MKLIYLYHSGFALLGEGYTIIFTNSGKLLLVPYTKDFGIITRF